VSVVSFIKQLRERGWSWEQCLDAAEAFEANAALIPNVPDVLAKKRERDRLRIAQKREAQRQSRDIGYSRATVADVAPVARQGDAASRAQVDNPSSSLRSEGYPPVKPIGLTAPRGAEARGTRLPDGWRPDEAGLAYAAGQLGMNVDPERELDRFRDYWRAVPGAKGRKMDWPATWRNWVRRAAENLPRKAHERPHTDAKFASRQANHAAALRGAERAAGQRWEP
jgi:hypothetical protein